MQQWLQRTARTSFVRKHDARGRGNVEQAVNHRRERRWHGKHPGRLSGAAAAPGHPRQAVGLPQASKGGLLPLLLQTPASQVPCMERSVAGICTARGQSMFVTLLASPWRCSLAAITAAFEQRSSPGLFVEAKTLLDQWGSLQRPVAGWRLHPATSCRWRAAAAAATPAGQCSVAVAPSRGGARPLNTLQLCLKCCSVAVRPGVPFVLDRTQHAVPRGACWLSTLRKQAPRSLTLRPRHSVAVVAYNTAQHSAAKSHAQHRRPTREGALTCGAAAAAA